MLLLSYNLFYIGNIGISNTSLFAIPFVSHLDLFEYLSIEYPAVIFCIRSHCSYLMMGLRLKDPGIRLMFRLFDGIRIRSLVVVLDRLNLLAAILLIIRSRFDALGRFLASMF